MYALTGNLAKAEECIRKGAELAGVSEDRWHAAAWRNLTVIELFLKNPDAEKHLATAIKCGPTEAKSWVLRAKINLERGSYEEALDDAKHADRMGEFQDPLAKRMRALAHLARGELDAAVEQARLALDLKDEPTINNLVLALAAAKSGEIEDAKAKLDVAEKAWPAALQTPGGFVADASTGDLWIESADERLRLKEQVTLLSNSR